MSYRLVRIRFSIAAALIIFVEAAIAFTLPFNFTYFGNFKQMSHTGETGGQIKLRQIPRASGTWGVGALAGLKGEIVVLDGKVLISRGNDLQGRLEHAGAEDEAVLFSSATISSWAQVSIPRDMNQASLEAFVVEQAKVLSIDTEQPFAFLVDGTYPSLKWHVVTGDKPTPSGTGGHAGRHGGGHANHKTAMKEFYNPGVLGLLVGIYSGKILEGVVSHPGERFHLHYVDRETTVSGHVDAYSVQAGATLRLPIGR